MQSSGNKTQQSDLPISKNILNMFWQIGFTGPGNEDKKYTSLNDNGFKEPDMYGVVVLANMIEMILSD
ncbi:MAG: hypothetical protein ACI9A7_000020 [Cyclobacteriaceae bacterium]|jgi:hypothetical protein